MATKEFLQFGCQFIARAAAGTGKDKQHAPTAQVCQREIALAIEPWEAEVGRGGARLQPVAFDLTASERTIVEAV
jgi:hypothetical protein